MEMELFECELLKKQLKKEEAGVGSKTGGTGVEGVVLNDHSRLRYFERILHPKSSAQLRLLEKIDLLKESKEERMHAYLNKIIRHIVDGKLDLH